MQHKINRLRLRRHLLVLMRYLNRRHHHLQQLTLQQKQLDHKEHYLPTTHHGSNLFLR
jgi:hypothetical protein